MSQNQDKVHESCNVCGRFLVQEWARAVVTGDHQEATRLKALMDRGYCDESDCEAVALGNSGQEGK